MLPDFSQMGGFGTRVCQIGMVSYTGSYQGIRPQSETILLTRSRGTGLGCATVGTQHQYAILPYAYTEKELEQSLINNLQQFLLELGKGFAFVARQKHIRTETADFFIDLVFYNYILKCFVIVELKTNRITHQDIGQLDMYVRMFDDLERSEGDNPTIGLLLCTATDQTIAKYSVLSESKQLFASKYLPYLPTEEELAAEIEREKNVLREEGMVYRKISGGFYV